MSKRTKKSLVAISSLLGLTFLAGCGENENTEHEHVFTNYVSNNDATCTKDGTKTAKCDKCDATDTQPDEGSMKLHRVATYVKNNDEGCTTNGTETGVCKDCGAKVTRTIPDSARHSFDYEYNNDATCNEDGTKTGKCIYCDEVNTTTHEGSALGHSFTNYVSNNDATCISLETKTAKCDRCDATDKIYVEGSYTGHTFETYVSDNNATCTEDGTKTAKCKYCNATDTIPDEGSATGHPMGTVYKFDTQYHWFESTCEHKIVEGKEAHSYGAPQIINPTPTCKGSIIYTCKCGYGYSEEIDNSDYICDKKVVDDRYLCSAATCTQKAKYYYSSTNGMHSNETFEVGELEPHNFRILEDNDKLKLVCTNCDFDSSKDYSNKADNKLNNENLADIILNSRFTVDYEDPDYFETVVYDGLLEVFTYGYIDGDDRIVDLCYYYNAIPLGENAFYCEYGTFEEVDGDLFKSPEGGRYLKTSELFQEYQDTAIGLAQLDYTYSNMAGCYLADSGYDEVKIKVSKTNGITAFEQFDHTLIDNQYPDEVIEALKAPTYEIAVNGKMSTTIFKDCPHNFVYHSPDSKHDRAYLYCSECGYSTENCGDMSCLSEEEYTSTQISDLLLNSCLAMSEVENNTLKTPTVYYRGAKVTPKRGDSYDWELFHNINDDIVYHETGAGYILDSNPKSPSLYTATGANATTYLDTAYKYDPVKLAALNYTFDESWSAYVAWIDEDTMVKVEVDGQQKITSVIVEEYGEIVYRDNAEFMSDVFDEAIINELGTIEATFVDKTATNGTITVQIGSNTFNINVKEYPNRLKVFKAWFEEEFGVEINGNTTAMYSSEDDEIAFFKYDEESHEYAVEDVDRHDMRERIYTEENYVYRTVIYYNGTEKTTEVAKYEIADVVVPREARQKIEDFALNTITTTYYVWDAFANKFVVDYVEEEILNDNENLLSKTKYKTVDGEKIVFYEEEYTYSDGLVYTKTIEEYDISDLDNIHKSKTISEIYDEHSNVISYEENRYSTEYQKLVGFNKYTAAFDSYGREIEYNSFGYDVNTDKYTQTYHSEKAYDSNNKLTKNIYYYINENGVVTSFYGVAYNGIDEQNRVLEEVTYDWDGSKIIIKSKSVNSYSDEMDIHEEFTYDVTSGTYIPVLRNTTYYDSNKHYTRKLSEQYNAKLGRYLTVDDSSYTWNTEFELYEGTTRCSYEYNEDGKETYYRRYEGWDSTTKAYITKEIRVSSYNANGTKDTEMLYENNELISGAFHIAGRNVYRYNGNQIVCVQEKYIDGVYCPHTKLVTTSLPTDEHWSVTEYRYDETAPGDHWVFVDTKTF